jgi:DnaJ domain
MGRGTAFAEILDEKLDGFEHAAVAPRPAPQLRVATSSHYWLQQHVQAPATAANVRRTAVASDHEAASAAATVASGVSRKIEPPRVPRTLSMKQQEALDALIRLGARIDRNFTDDELRSVFRTLALRYHPDRHVNSDDAERQRLSMLFARAVTAYELLKTATPRLVH